MIKLNRSGYKTNGDNKTLFSFKPAERKGEYVFITKYDLIDLYNQLPLRDHE